MNCILRRLLICNVVVADGQWGTLTLSKGFVLEGVHPIALLVIVRAFVRAYIDMHIYMSESNDIRFLRSTI
jgi:hypothetical protein